MVNNHYNSWNFEHKAHGNSLLPPKGLGSILISTSRSERDSLFSRYLTATASHPPREDWGVSPLMRMIPTLRRKVVNHYNFYLEAAKTEGKFSASSDIQKWVEEIPVTAPPWYVLPESRSIEMAPFEMAPFEMAPFEGGLYTLDLLLANVTANWATIPLTGISAPLIGTSTLDHGNEEEDGD